MPEGVRNCGCVGPECDKVSFEPDAFDSTAAAVGAGERDLVAHTGGFDPQHVLAAVSAGGMVVDLADGGLIFELAASAAGTAAGVALAASMDSSGPVVRPLIDDEQSTYTDADGIRHYTDAHVSSLLIKTAQDPSGWKGVELVDDAPEPPRPRSEGYRGGLYLWL